MLLSTVAAGLLLADVAHAASVEIPVPRPKPMLPQTEALVPIPRVKPQQQAPASEQAQPTPEQFPAPTESAEAKWSEETIAIERKFCTDKLKGLDVIWKTAAPIGSPDSCGAPAPIEVTEVAGVAVKPAATLTCAMTVALHSWMKDSVQPAAKRELGQSVVAIRNGSSYVCRTRNHVKGAKMSEHAKANALDMAGFDFAGSQTVSVQGSDASNPEAYGNFGPARFLEMIRKDACTAFTTVLGPGSDPYHGDHFHVDVLARKNGYRICQ